MRSGNWSFASVDMDVCNRMMDAGARAIKFIAREDNLSLDRTDTLLSICTHKQSLDLSYGLIYAVGMSSMIRATRLLITSAFRLPTERTSSCDTTGITGRDIGFPDN